MVPLLPASLEGPTVSMRALYAAPEIRVAVPLPAKIRVGVAIAALLTSSFEVRPTGFVQAGSCGGGSCTSNGRAIGFVPQVNTTPESQMDHLYLVRGSLFASIGF